MTVDGAPTPGEARDWLGLALDSTAATLLERRPGDPDAGLHAAIDQFASSLDVESVCLYRVGDDHLTCRAAWSPGNTLLDEARRASVVDPLLELLRPHLVRTRPRALGFAELDAESLEAMGQWGTNVGAIAIVPTMAGDRQIGGITVAVRDDRPWFDDHFRALDNLALALHFFVDRCEADAGRARSREIEGLRSFTTARYLEPVAIRADADRATGDVLARVAATFEPDLVLWGNRIDPDDRIPGLLYRPTTGTVEPMPTDRLRSAALVSQAPGHAVVTLDAAAHAALGLDPDVAADATTTVLTTRVGDREVGGLALIDVDGGRTLSDPERETLAEINHRIHEFETQVKERQAMHRHRRFDAMRIALAEEFLAQNPSSIDELIDAALPAIGEAFDAWFIVYRPALPGGVGFTRWISPAATEALDEVDDVDALLESVRASFDAHHAPRPMRTHDLSPSTRATLSGAGIEEITLLRASVSDEARQATLAVATLGDQPWDTREHVTLVSIGTQLQQMVDTISARAEVEAHTAIGDLTSRCATHMVEIDDLDEAIDRVLEEIGDFFGGRYVVWLHGDHTDRTLEATHGWPEGVADAPPYAFNEVSWQIMIDRLTTPQHTTWERAPDEVHDLMRPAADSTHIAVPIQIEGDRFRLLDAEVGAYPHGDAAVRGLEAISGMMWQVQSRRRVQQLFSTTFQSAPTGQALLDEDGVVTTINQALRDLLGDIVGRSWTDLDAGWRPGSAGENSAGREVPLTLGDHSAWARVRLSSIPTDNQMLTLVHVEDISTERANRAALEYQASHDKLTGLGNRRTLETELAAALAEGPATALMLDLDRFKVVNDSLGHAAGDRVLTTIADRLSTAVRGEDSVCRFGGDEFTIIVPGEIEPFEIASLAARIIELVMAPIEIEQATVINTTSIGIARGGPGDDPSRLLRHADAALYSAKAGGRNRYEVFDEADSEAVRDRLHLETAIRSAVRNEEFLAFFQPEVDLITRQVLGVEALVRWDRPDVDILAADQFIDEAEELGLAPAISSQMLDVSAAQLRGWIDTGHDIHVRVNIAAAQLQTDALIAEVAHALGTYGLEPRHLCIEVTERSLLVDIESASRTLGQIRDLGVQVAIDDFGTGFSSLAWLKTLPIDTLKIDRAFVSGLEHDVADRQIVETIIRLAHVLGVDVVAEGVETEGQASMLLELGCSRAQGWLWSPAVPAERIPSLLGDPEGSHPI